MQAYHILHTRHVSIVVEGALLCVYNLTFRYNHQPQFVYV